MTQTSTTCPTCHDLSPPRYNSLITKYNRKTPDKNNVQSSTKRTTYTSLRLIRTLFLTNFDTLFMFLYPKQIRPPLFVVEKILLAMNKKIMGQQIVKINSMEITYIGGTWRNKELDKVRNNPCHQWLLKMLPPNVLYLECMLTTNE